MYNFTHPLWHKQIKFPTIRHFLKFSRIFKPQWDDTVVVESGIDYLQVNNEASLSTCNDESMTPSPLEVDLVGELTALSPVSTHTHCNCILNDMAYIIKHAGQLKILLPAICWHDVIQQCKELSYIDTDDWTLGKMFERLMSAKD